MAEMDDYSGEYKPDLQFSDLSKEALAKLVENYQRICQGFCTVTVDVMQKELGKDEAQRIFNRIYARVMEQYAVPLVRKALNIQGNDVISMFKYFQMAPDGRLEGGAYDFAFEIKNNNDVTYTGNFCQNANYYEKHGDTEGMHRLCAGGPGSFEHAGYEAIAKAFNPDIKMEWPLLPPRTSKDAPFCMWRFWVDEKTENKG